MFIRVIALKLLCYAAGAAVVFTVFPEEKPAPQKRCFLIGYTGEVENGTNTGGYDTCLVSYPNLYQFKKFFIKKFNLKNLYILSITEYSAKDRQEFWRKD